MSLRPALSPCSMVIAALHAGWSSQRVRIDAIDCSRQAIAAARRGLVVTALDERNSGDTAGDRRRVVGYGAYSLT